MHEKKTSKRKTPASEAEKALFATRLRECMKIRGENQTSLSDKIGIQRQTISLYMNGQSSPNTEILTAIAKALDVSSDYLLGLSDVPQINADIQAACKFTGLTPNALQSLRQFNNAIWCIGYTPLNPSAVISQVCENKNFYGLIHEIASALYYKNRPKSGEAEFKAELAQRFSLDKMASLNELDITDWINMVYPLNTFLGSVALDSDEAAKHHMSNACYKLQKIVEELMENAKKNCENRDKEAALNGKYQKD